MPGPSPNQKSQTGLTNVSKYTKMSTNGTAPPTQNMQGALNLFRMKEFKHVPINVAVGAAKVSSLKSAKTRKRRNRRNRRRATRRN